MSQGYLMKVNKKRTINVIVRQKLPYRVTLKPTLPSLALYDAGLFYFYQQGKKDVYYDQTNSK